MGLSGGSCSICNVHICFSFFDIIYGYNELFKREQSVYKFAVWRAAHDSGYSDLLFIGKKDKLFIFGKMVKYLSIVVFLLCGYKSYCDVVPNDNSSLNFTSVYFEEEFETNASEYILFIYTDSTAVGTANVLEKVSGGFPAFWISDLKWDMRYFWKIKAYDKRHRELNSGQLHRFSIIKRVFGNPDSVKIAVKTNDKTAHAGGLICIDYTRSIYNRTGKAFYTIPLISGIVTERTQIRDIKVNQGNTITFLTEKFPVEINPAGTVLWKAPFPFVLDKDTIVYHHDFKKTSRGTYMVLGNKKINRRLIGDYSDVLSTESETEKVGSVVYKKAVMTVLLEFNAKGELLWFWDANSYITDEDLNARKGQSGFPEFTTHSNAFSENKSGDKIYVGFRDLSRIIRIDKKTKKVEATYGTGLHGSGETVLARDLFDHQHDATVTEHGSILVFNNNNPGAATGKIQQVSSVLELNENDESSGAAILWKFDLDFDNLTNGKSSAGGNVVEFPNSNLLVCGGNLNRIFEVTRQKRIVWDAFILMKTKNDTSYKPFPQYRCSWTAQLNEYHFIGYYNFKRSGGQEKLIIRIINTGNVHDSYEVEIASLDAKGFSNKQTDTLSPGKITELEFEPGDLNFLVDDLSVVVKSKNSLTSKKLMFQDFKR
jgi:hypothetical protein